MWRRRALRSVLAGLLLQALVAASAGATPLLQNGDFEQGLTGWSRAGILYFGVDGVQQRSSFSEWHLYDDPGAPWQEFVPGILPAGGDDMATYYSDGPVLGILYQGFTVPVPDATVVVSFDFFTQAGPDVWPCGFDMDCAAADPSFDPDDLFRVDLVRAEADVFSTAPGEHLPLLDGTDSFVFPAVPYPYLHAELDVSAFVAGGGDFLLRFAGYGGDLSHVDNASVELLVPEPGTGLLLGLALCAALRSRAIR